MKTKFREFQYNQLQATETWSVVDDAIKQLAENKDLVETTDRRYIVGFILKQLDDNKLLKTVK
jgi:hypothetical protein